MRISPKFAVVAIVSLLSLQTVHAAEVTIPAGRESAINFVTGVTPNCRNIAKPKMTVVKAPEHGSVRFQWVKYKISNISKLCDGRPAWGMAILFKPKAGFHGKDRFTYGMNMQKYEGRSDTKYIQDAIDVVVK